MTDTVDARPLLEGARPEGDAAFARYIRTGATLETKAFTGVTGEQGGVAIPSELDARIDAQLVSFSPIRAIANVVQVGSAGYRKLITSGGTPSGWAGETDPRPVTATPIFHELVPPHGELYANPSASQAMLDDALFDSEAWLADEIATEFAKAEGAAFVTGSGLGRPRGFLTAPASAEGDGARAFGTLQYLPSGAAGTFAGDPGERLIDLVQALRAPYRQGACFVMNAATAALVRKVKTRDGQFLWQPGLAAAQPATLLGYPVVEAGDMPDVAAGSAAIAFGNFRLGYLIADRGDTAVLRDPYSNKPFVTFYATRRIGGCVSDSDAIKLLKFVEK
ncbi:phage major capsid protein [Sphingomonas sp. RHCKR7]|uniref:phage major capsid protein n=1 Tax=Sphingomonas folli TaxID=2862497 RepID=UPI001CA4D4CF|nr:phage major capsid protein [Sphingomonas folli]MBW6528777.1 phage major capsid protein [Sphingomonas folli]